MASEESKDLVPDAKVLSELFPTIDDLSPDHCHVISNTWTTCTSLIEFKETCPPNYPKKVILRLEQAEGRLPAMAAIQRLARSCLSELVPLVLDVGTTKNTALKDLDYIVTEYIEDAVLLEEIWNTIGETHQQSLVASVANEMHKPHKIEPSALAQGLPGTPFETDTTSPSKILLGGPAIGYFPDIKGFLEGIIQDGDTPGCELSDRDNGIAIKSNFEDIGEVELSHQELDDLAHQTVLCHNDLEPRNVLVKEVSPGEYQLAGIIDWEMAAVFPFAYEYGLKDVVLGSSNLYFSWYTHFKSLTSSLLPPAECHAKFIKVLRIIYQSRDRRPMTRNVGVLF